MPYFDWPLEQLQTYTPPRNEPADFDAFWQNTLATTRTYPLNATFTPVDSGLRLVETYDVTFAGYNGQPIKGWYIRPANTPKQLPCVVEFIGYNGGRNFSFDWLLWANAGYAHLVMDTRGQGSGWMEGATQDHPEAVDPHIAGFMTMGILNPETYYYRRVFSDAARAVETAMSREDVDATRIAVMGGSQGGGISIAAAALSPQVSICMSDVPFLCHFRRAVGLTASYPYKEISDYLRIHRTREAHVMNTLDYFDGVNFAARIHAKSLFSVGLMDEVCPPSTIFAAYNQLQGEKEIHVYNHNGHEGGGALHTVEKLRFLRSAWGETL